MEKETHVHAHQQNHKQPATNHIQISVTNPSPSPFFSSSSIQIDNEQSPNASPNMSHHLNHPVSGQPLSSSLNSTPIGQPPSSPVPLFKTHSKSRDCSPSRSVVFSCIKYLPRSLRMPAQNFLKMEQVRYFVLAINYIAAFWNNYQKFIVFFFTAIPFCIAVFDKADTQIASLLDISSLFPSSRAVPDDFIIISGSESNSANSHIKARKRAYHRDILTPSSPIYDNFTWEALVLEAALQNRTDTIKKKEVEAFGDPLKRKVSLLSSCKNQEKHLAEAFNSWTNVNYIYEIIIVDWGSIKGWDEINALVSQFSGLSLNMKLLTDQKSPIYKSQQQTNSQALNDDDDRNLLGDQLSDREDAYDNFELSLFQNLVVRATVLGAFSPSNFSAKVVLIAMTNQSVEWTPSSAYNLAAKFATGNYLMRVDCDITLQPYILETIPLEADEKAFYRVPYDEWNGKWLHEFIFVKKSYFDLVHGYDERISKVGVETDDLMERLEKQGLYGVNMNIATLHRLKFNSGSKKGKRTESSLSTMLWKNINNKSRSWNEPWDEVYDKHSADYDLKWSGNAGFIRATLVKESLKHFESLPRNYKVEVLRNSSFDVLQHECGLPHTLLRQLTLVDLKNIISTLDIHNSRHVLLLALNSSLPDNLFYLLWGVSYAKMTKRPLIIVSNVTSVEASKRGVTNPDKLWPFHFEELFKATETKELLSEFASVSSVRNWDCYPNLAKCKADETTGIFEIGGHGWKGSITEDQAKNVVMNTLPFHAAKIMIYSIPNFVTEFKMMSFHEDVVEQVEHMQERYNPKHVEVIYASITSEAIEEFLELIEIFPSSPYFVSGPDLSIVRQVEDNLIEAHDGIEVISPGLRNARLSERKRELADILYIIKCSKIFPQAPSFRKLKKGETKTLTELKADVYGDIPGMAAIRVLADLENFRWNPKVIETTG